MKVPTYNRQTGITNKTGATRMTVQASPGALAAGLRGLAGAAGSAEKVAVSWYETENKLRRAEEVAKSEMALELELAELGNNQLTRDPSLIIAGDPAKNELSFGGLGQQIIDRLAIGMTDKKSRSAFQARARQALNLKQISVNQDARNRLIDQRAATEYARADILLKQAVNGSGAQRKSAMQDLFGAADGSVMGLYDQMAADGLIKQTKAGELSRTALAEVQKKNNEADTARLFSNVNKRVLIVGDTSKPLAEREQQLLTTAGDFSEAINAGLITREKAVEVLAKASDDTVRAIGMDLMTKSDDATATILSIAAGDSGDVIMDRILADMDPSDAQKAINDMFTTATKIDTERREQREAAEADANENNERLFKEILNVDTSSAAAMSVAKESYDYLLRQNFFNATQRKAAETRLGLNTKPDDPKVETQRDAISALTRADANNMLTIELVETYSDQLSMSDFQEYQRRALSENDQGRKDAKDLIASSLRYQEFQDTTDALGKVSNEMFQRSINELQLWYNDEGKGATYQQSMAKAREINASNKEEYLGAMQVAFIEYLDSVMSMLPGLTYDPEKPVETALESLADMPSGQLRNSIILYVKSFKKLGIR